MAQEMIIQEIQMRDLQRELIWQQLKIAILLMLLYMEMDL